MKTIELRGTNYISIHKSHRHRQNRNTHIFEGINTYTTMQTKRGGINLDKLLCSAAIRQPLDRTSHPFRRGSQVATVKREVLRGIVTHNVHKICNHIAFITAQSARTVLALYIYFMLNCSSALFKCTLIYYTIYILLRYLGTCIITNFRKLQPLITYII